MKNKFGNFDVAQNKIDISYIDFDGEISYIMHTRECNLFCSYCHNRKSLMIAHGMTAYDYLKEMLFNNKMSISKIKHLAITGGEPLIHGDDLIAFIKILKNYDFNVKLDTNGTLSKDLLNVIKYVDYVAMDIKWDIFDNSGIIYAINKNTDWKSINLNIKTSLNILLHSYISSEVDFELRTTLCSPYFKDAADFLRVVKLVDDYTSIRYNIKNKIPWYIQKPMCDKHIVFNNKINHQPIIIDDEDLGKYKNFELIKR